MDPWDTLPRWILALFILQLVINPSGVMVTTLLWCQGTQLSLCILVFYGRMQGKETPIRIPVPTHGQKRAEEKERAQPSFPDTDMSHAGCCWHARQPRGEICRTCLLRQQRQWPRSAVSMWMCKDSHRMIPISPQHIGLLRADIS